jgi:tRNA(Ile)-lysidine synthase
VRELGRQLGVPVYVKKFQTKEYAAERKLSIQMAARELRYEWFSGLAATENYQRIATAHHLNDHAETILLKLVKGAVLSGLHGILPLQGNLVRPLLWATKEEIQGYANEHRLLFREDSSNLSTKYERNLIRHEVIPFLKKLNPDLEHTLHTASQHRRQIEKRFMEWAEELKEKTFNGNEEGGSIKINDLYIYKVDEAALWQMLSGYGFSYMQICELFGSLKNTESKLFFSAGFRLAKDREKLYISRIRPTTEKEGSITIPGDGVYNFAGENFEFRTLKEAEKPDFGLPGILYLDKDKLIFPLTLRKWKTGDSFIPFGMKGSKKVSDYLTDIKAGFSEKEEQTVLTSSGAIVGLPGLRASETVKIEALTKHILRLAIIP